MSLEVRKATARDRRALRQFYSREGISFARIASRAATIPMGPSSETMFVIAISDGMIGAAYKLDIGENPDLGKIGFIQHFEIEDELEKTDLGERMLKEAEKIADERNLRAVDAIVSENRPEIIEIYSRSHFEEEHKEIYLRRKFGNRVF